MALTKDYTNNVTGLSLNKAYIRISKLAWLYDDAAPAMMITLDYYVNKAARKAGKAPFERTTVGIFKDTLETEFTPQKQDTSGKNLLKLVYEYLKTTPDFVDAVDDQTP